MKNIVLVSRISIAHPLVASARRPASNNGEQQIISEKECRERNNNNSAYNKGDQEIIYLSIVNILT